MDVTVEFTSMSKTFSMPGWRMGFAVGNERIIAALARVKSYLDYGAFTPIQAAAAAALNGPEDCIREMRATYKKRRDALVDSFGRAGWHGPAAAPPRCSPGRRCPNRSARWAAWNSPSCWSRRPRSRFRPASPSASTAKAIVRIALVENEQRIRQAARNIRRFLDTGLEKLHNVVPLATRR